jgi:hypothetical protein
MYDWNPEFGPSRFGGKEEWLLKFLRWSKSPKWNPTLGTMRKKESGGKTLTSDLFGE